MPPDEAHESAPPLVLVVEDDFNLREVIGDVLDAEGYRRVMTADGVTALEQCSSSEFVAALVDLHLPGRAGTSVAEELLRRQPGIRVILMTGEASAKPPAGVSLILKPFSVESLLRELRTVERPRARSPRAPVSEPV